MKHRLLDYFARRSPLSPAERQAIDDSMVVKSYAAGHHLLEAGQVCTRCWFVLEGCVREYTLAEGEEHTTGFFTEEQWVLSLDSFTRGVPAGHFLVCAEPTSVVVGDEAKEKDLFRQFPRFQELSRRVLQEVLAEHQAQLGAFRSERAEQRYQRLVRDRPELLQRLPQYQIASYLGVRPESLSRLRRRLVTAARRPKSRSPA